MLFFFPYSTDAPVYHYPIGTIGLIVVNTLVFMLTWSVQWGLSDAGAAWCLYVGAGIHPLQWFTASFLHLDPQHLLFNMLFLWTYGLVVEGKLGWWRFLLLYGAIATLASALVQVLTLDLEPTIALGASDAIFGLLMVAVIWAPKNEIYYGYFMWILFIVRAGTQGVAIMLVAAAYLALQVLFWVMQDFALSSEALHLSGAVWGALFGGVLLRWKWVDCEGWDIISVWKGDYGAFRKEPAAEEIEAQVAEKKQERAEEIFPRIATLLQQDQPRIAFALYEKLQQRIPDVELPQKLQHELIRALDKQVPAVAGRVPLMADYVRRFPDQSAKMRLRLAQILLTEQRRPGQALRLLERTPEAELPEQFIPLRRKLIAQAKQQRAEGELELAPEDW